MLNIHSFLQALMNNLEFWFSCFVTQASQPQSEADTWRKKTSRTQDKENKSIVNQSSS